MKYGPVPSTILNCCVGDEMTESHQLAKGLALLIPLALKPF